MIQKLIPLHAKSEWINVLKKVPHAFAHTWENCHAMQLSTGWDTHLYHLKDQSLNVICPIAERDYSGYTDIVTPYGFSGFSGNGDCPDLQHHWKKFAEKREYVCGYISLNTILENNQYYSTDEIFSNNIMYALDLTESLDRLYKNLSTNRRRQVKNHEEYLDSFSMNKSLVGKFFLENYHDFFSERVAPKLSSFSIKALSSLIQSDNVILIGKVIKKRVVAVSVFAHTPYIADYLFNISTEKGREFTVSLLWEGIRILKGKQIPTLNLGGGVKKDDSLAEFKKRFGGKEFPIAALKQVYDKEGYLSLCKHADVTAGLNGFFPPYHNPKIIGK